MNTRREGTIWVLTTIPSIQAHNIHDAPQHDIQ